MTALILVAPAANRVYAGEADRLVAGELRVLLGLDADQVSVTELAGVGYVRVETAVDERLLAALGRLSAFLAGYELEDDRLRPFAVPRTDRFDDDLVTIPKYPGKTNEQFTRLLLNLTLATVDRPGADGPLQILDPLCGRGTTLSTGLILGHHVAGLDADAKALEAYAAFLRTYLRRKRLKHSVEVTPVRREGRSLGRRLDAEIRPQPDDAPLTLTMFSGDTRQSAALYGKRRFDVIVADAPYGIVHGSQTDVRGVSGKRDRSAAGLIGEALPVWASQLRAGGALGLSWNTHGLSREQLLSVAVEAGLEPLDDPVHRGFSHRVDSSIHRDILLARKVSDR